MLSSRILSRTSRPAAQWLKQSTGRRMASSMPKTEESTQTVGQRLKSWASALPVEIYPLFVVMGFSLSIGTYSLFRKLNRDGTLRLQRQGLKGHNSPMSFREVEEEK